MHPALAGLIGAGLAVLVCLFAYLIVRGRENWRRLEAQQAAALVADEVRAILLTLREGALLVGPHDEIVVVNEAGEALSLARGSRVGFPELLVTVREVRASGRPFDGTIVREAQPGTERLEVAAHVRPLGNDRVLVLGVDESGERRVEAVRRDFVANISHELKTPIGAISVLSEALAAARDDPEAVDLFSGRLQRETARLAELINQIIDLSRLQSEDPMLSRELVDVGEVVAEAVSRSQERATQRGVGLIVAHTDVVRVMGDRWQLADAITNLVQNAINYSNERARVTISVQAVAQDGDDFVDVKVSDNGIGIRPEEQERIFERFYRVDYDRSRASGGTGLGLSIVKHILGAHGGTVNVWSKLGQGSTFTLRLPAHEEADLPEEAMP